MSETGFDYGLAESLQTLRIQSDVVVREEYGACPVRFSIPDVGDNAIDRKLAEPAAVHEIDGAELAALCASPAGLHRVDRNAQAVEAFREQPGIPVGHLYVFNIEQRPRGIMNHPLALMVGEAQNLLGTSVCHLGQDQLPEGGLPLAANNVVYERRILAFADLFCG